MSPKTTSVIATALLSLVVVVAMLLISGYRFDAAEYEMQHPPKDPPEGFEISLGSPTRGQGDTPAPATPRSSEAAAPHHPSRSATQRQSAARVSTSTDTHKEEVRQEEPRINQNAIATADRFKQLRNRNNGQGNGNNGNAGNQGALNGDPSSSNTVRGGVPGGSYSLAGRSAVSLPKPVYNSNQQGTVVVRIWVDKRGRVTRAEYEPKGSNSTNDELIRWALDAARKARFNQDDKALEEQMGTITYFFKI